MPVDKQVLLRYQVLNKCFRNRYREYTIDDLVDECNKALRKADKPDVSKRSVQNDISILEADYGINYIRTKPLHLSQRIVEETEDYAIISINVKVNKELESLILSFGEDIEVMAPASFRDRIAEKIQATNKKYTDK